MDTETLEPLSALSLATWQLAPDGGDDGSQLVREVIRPFSGKRRLKEWRECECGCGEWFKASVGDGKRTINSTHRKRKSRQMSHHV
ncbi:MAG: hypothetical protein HY869_21040 [Chloroflexi bacterium]|nr:hypothetical protein [Chloroflexota bacterium]